MDKLKTRITFFGRWLKQLGAPSVIAVVCASLLYLTGCGLAPVTFKYTNETASRYPFTDLYYTDSGKQVWGSFIARPVIGGLFAKMLV